jgi:CheY-like chemotaxis protein
VKTILLADDSITIQKVVELTFSDGDYQVYCVSTGAQALRKVSEVRPDIILLDVIMPEKNGYEVCEALKADPQNASIPVLLLTGTFEPFDRRRAETAGAAGHLTKPFESHTLVGRVEELIAASRFPRAGSTPATADASMGSLGAESAAPARAGLEASAPMASPGAPPPAPPVEPARAAAPQMLPPPDAASGGSYMGFADLGLDEESESVVPDRFDDGAPADAVRMTSGQSLPVSAFEPDPESPDEAASAATEQMEGFVSGYDMPDSMRRPAYARRDREEPLGTPPANPDTAQPAAPPHAGGAVEGSLSQETLDRLADMVVRKISDRVVREIAWEVIPGVAESVVRQRIKELEEQKG